MHITSPEDRAILWSRLIAARDEDDRESWVRVLAAELLAELRGEFDLYSGYEDEFVATIRLLDRCEALLDQDMLRSYQAIGIDSESGGRFFATIVGRLGRVASDERLTPDIRAQAADLQDLWSEVIAKTEEGEMLTVAQVAARFGVTPQAVYKWIDSGRVDAERTPGGRGIRLPARQFRLDRSSHDRLRRLERRLSARVPPDAGPSDADVADAIRRRRTAR